MGKMYAIYTRDYKAPRPYWHVLAVFSGILLALIGAYFLLEYVLRHFGFH